MSDQKQTNGNEVNDERRKVVRNLLTGAGVTAGVGAVASSTWMEPVINTVMLPAHAQMSEVTMATGCCPYYFDPVTNWCYDDGAAQNGNTGPAPGGFSVQPWNQPDNCPVT